MAEEGIESNITYIFRHGWENTPDEIKPYALKYFEENTKNAANYARKWGWENTPDEIKPYALKGFEVYPWYASMHVERHGWENTPDEIKPYALKYFEENPNSVSDYVKERGWENTPPEMLKSTKFAYGYAMKKGWENTPIEMLKTPRLSFVYVAQKGWENTPDEIKPYALKYFEENPFEAYDYVTRHGWENTPDEIKPYALKGFEVYSGHTYDYVKKIGWENTPPEILKIPFIAYRYVKEKGWENTPDEIRKSSIEWIKKDPRFTNFNFIETTNDKEFIQSIEESPNYKKWYEIPKKEAQKYNKQLGGLFIHSLYSDQAEFTLSPSDKLKGEICVSTIAADSTFRSEIIVVGRGELRLLFPFDCYSVKDSSGLRYGTTKAWMMEKLGEIEDEEEQKEKMKELGIEEMKGSYYDEGFIRPNDAEWLLITGKNKNKAQELSNKFDIKYVDIEEFNDALKSENLHKFYDLIQGNSEQEPHEYDDLYESFSSVEIFKLKLLDIVS